MPISSTPSVSSASHTTASTSSTTPSVGSVSNEVAGTMAFNTSSDSHTICFC